MKTKIKIGGVACNLEDMPPSFQDAIKSKMIEDGISIKEKNDNDNVRVKKGNEKVFKIEKVKNQVATVSIYRKMFGYKS